MISNIDKELKKFKFTNNVIKGLFFLLLGISSNFIGDTMGCQVQKLFNESIIFKQLIIFFTIFFGIDISDGKDLTLRNKLEISFIVFILFTVLGNMNIKFSILGFGLVTVLYLINTYISELKSKAEAEDNNEIKKKYFKIKEFRRNLSLLFLGCIIVGVFFYYKLKKEEFGDRFNIISFFFEQNKCKFNEELDLNINFLTGQNMFN